MCNAMASISGVTASSRFMRVASTCRSTATSSILDMAAVFPQMQRDAVRAGGLRHQRGLHRARIAGAARLAQGRNVIDVHAQMNHGDYARSAAGSSSGEHIHADCGSCCISMPFLQL